MAVYGRSILIATFSVLSGCTFRVAAVSVPQAPLPDPPGRVARLSYLTGAVSFKPAGTGDWVPAALNRPLTAGDELWTEGNARLELDLGHAFVRLDGQTSAGILALDDDAVQIRIAAGAAQVHLRRLDSGDHFEIDTPQAAITLLRPGDYRVLVNPNGGETETVVRTGDLEVNTPGAEFQVRAGQRASVSGLENVGYAVTPAPAIDEFDVFCQTRDRREQRAEALQHVSPYVIGWEDLDEYGYWTDYAPYGPVWIPRGMGPDWAPYRFGHWLWIEPWGWTWIDDAPWGFAPFHYGRWAVIGVNWCWVPGPIHVRAVYAPALVVFAGGGPGFRYYFGVGGGAGVAWFPLGPREVYVPPYRSSRVYVTNINVSQTVVVNRDNIWRTDPERQHYINRNERAFTAVHEDVFAGGRPVGRAAMRVTKDQISSARIGGSAPPVAPSRTSIAPPRESGPPAPRPPEAVSDRHVTVRRTPAPAAVPFEQKRNELDRNPGRPPDTGRIGDLRRQQTEATPKYRQVQPQQQSGRGQPSGGVPAPAVPPVGRGPSAGGAQKPAGQQAAPPSRPSQSPPEARQPSQRQVENRRRIIDQEHQRAQTPQPQQRQQRSR